MQPRIFHELPDGFLDALPRDMEDLLGAPALIHLDGVKQQPLFISILLHGNEHSSLFAMQALLKKYRASGELLPRKVVMFVGNVYAAHRNSRLMPGQRDYNRIWDREGDSEEHRMARFVVDYVRRLQPFACIDIHNNTGANPNYTCANYLDRETLTLARMFSPTMVYFTEPHEVLVNTFGEFCPSVAVECGLSGERSGVESAIAMVEEAMRVDELSTHPALESGIQVYESMVRVRLPQNSLFDFGQDNVQVDFRFPDDFEHFNFVVKDAGNCLGWRLNPELELEVVDNNGRNVAEEFLYYEGTEIRLRQSVVPSMFTKDKQAVITDCLGYFMRRYDVPEPPSRYQPESEKLASGI